MISFRTLWAVAAGSALGAILIGAFTGDWGNFDVPFTIAILVLMLKFMLSRGWIDD